MEKNLSFLDKMVKDSLNNYELKPETSWGDIQKKMSDNARHAKTKITGKTIFKFSVFSAIIASVIAFIFINNNNKVEKTAIINTHFVSTGDIKNVFVKAKELLKIQKSEINKNSDNKDIKVSVPVIKHIITTKKIIIRDTVRVTDTIKINNEEKFSEKENIENK